MSTPASTPKPSAPPRVNLPGLHRRIGLLGALASGIGIVLGAGAYVLVGEAAGIAGNGVWLAFLVGALLAAATGLAYAELTSMLPEAGAAASYARVAFGPRAGFVTGWMDVTVNAIAVPAVAVAVAIGFARYVADLLPLNPVIIAVGVLLLCAGIVLLGVTETVAVGSLLATVKAAGLLVVIAVGIPHLGEADLFSIEGGAAGLLGAAALVFFAYDGFEEIATLSEEVQATPSRAAQAATVMARCIFTSLRSDALRSVCACEGEPGLAPDNRCAIYVRVAGDERDRGLLGRLECLAFDSAEVVAEDVQRHRGFSRGGHDLVDVCAGVLDGGELAQPDRVLLDLPYVGESRSCAVIEAAEVALDLPALNKTDPAVRQVVVHIRGVQRRHDHREDAEVRILAAVHGPGRGGGGHRHQELLRDPAAVGQQRLNRRPQSIEAGSVRRLTRHDVAEILHKTPQHRLNWLDVVRLHESTSIRPARPSPNGARRRPRL
ncbi:MAG: APC family permease [Dehalococcoidia bacterium]|nr:APC family permease [Dehalococcoidia bacterium]